MSVILDSARTMRRAITWMERTRAHVLLALQTATVLLISMNASPILVSMGPAET